MLVRHLIGGKSTGTRVSCAFLTLAVSAPQSVCAPASESKREITVRDAIEMAEFIEDSVGRVAWFSPDGTQFVVVLKRGNLDRNENDFQLLRFWTRDFPGSIKPELLLTLSSSSNGDAVKDVKWMPDNRTIIFQGEHPGEAAQVYRFDTKEKRLQPVSNSHEPIEAYGASADGRTISYITKPRHATGALERIAENSMVVPEGLTLSELLSQSRDQAAILSTGEQLFIERNGHPVRQISVGDFIPEWGPAPQVSPDGRYVLVGVVVRSIPGQWNQYQDPRLQRIIASPRPEGRPIFFVERYLLIDTGSGAVRPLLDTPMVGFQVARWSADSRSIFLKNVYLPLAIGDQAEQERRQHTKFDAEVAVPTGEVRVVPEQDWPSDERGAVLRVIVKQSMTLAPKLYAEDSKGNSRMLLDPNPSFAELDFGEVELFEWEASDGHKMKGELYKPPDFTPGKRYPLVIQTHGFAPNRFWMDGPWGSAFSARALAANGMLVLQLDYDRSVTVTAGEGRREKASYEGAILELDRKGWVDPHRVGISGFSRSVYHVEYALTHSDCLFAAANLVDGVDAGYLQYLAYGSNESAKINDGKPFGYGLAAWVANSPGFQLGRLRAPVRMQSHGALASLLNFWEWFALLSEMQRPVELAYIPDAPHILVKPRDRRMAQEGVVDWFRFWLKAEEDSDASKVAQYGRWRELRKLQEANPVATAR
jgi:dipeptidyl aminopeptidase/acylaminoacyl peptidase